MSEEEDRLDEIRERLQEQQDNEEPSIQSESISKRFLQPKDLKKARRSLRKSKLVKGGALTRGVSAILDIRTRPKRTVEELVSTNMLKAISMEANRIPEGANFMDRQFFEDRNKDLNLAQGSNPYYGDWNDKLNLSDRSKSLVFFDENDKKKKLI